MHRDVLYGDLETMGDSWWQVFEDLPLRERVRQDERIVEWIEEADLD